MLYIFFYASLKPKRVETHFFILQITFNLPHCSSVYGSFPNCLIWPNDTKGYNLTGPQQGTMPGDSTVMVPFKKRGFYFLFKEEVRYSLKGESQEMKIHRIRMETAKELPDQSHKVCIPENKNKGKVGQQLNGKSPTVEILLTLVSICSCNQSQQSPWDWSCE